MSLEKLYKLYSKTLRVTTDSREVPQGSIFFALKGDHFDGNRFAGQALKKGASLAVVDDPSLRGLENCMLVPDVLDSLQQLAARHRKHFNIPVLGITGSNGKTTTKELIFEVLSNRFRCLATKGNLNNHIGVPLTLLSMPLDTEFAIIEMGANHRGEIETLSRIARPNHGLITNIGKAHLEGFGGLEGVKKGKSELYRFLAKHEGKAFVNADEPWLEDLSEQVKDRLIYRRGPEGINGGLGSILLEATVPFVKGSFVTEKGSRISFRSNLMGMYNFNNIMSAIILGRYFKVPSEEIARAIENYLPDNNRSQIIKKGNQVFFLDAYNANPSSMQGSMRQFARQEGRPKWVVLGSMLELGEGSDHEHREIVRLAVELGFDRILLVGPGFSGTSGKGNTEYFEDIQEVRDGIWDQLPPTCHVMLKGSRKIALEKLLTE